MHEILRKTTIWILGFLGKFVTKLEPILSQDIFLMKINICLDQLKCKKNPFSIYKVCNNFLLQKPLYW